MIHRAPTANLHPEWLDGSQRGDVFLFLPVAGVVHLCLRADEATTWVIEGEVPATIDEAREMVADVLR